MNTNDTCVATKTKECQSKIQSIEVTPTPETTPAPDYGNDVKFAGSSTLPPTCPEGNTIKSVANLHVLRNGSFATVNFFITEGSQANIYYKEVGSSDWQFAVAEVKPNGDNFVSYTIGGLKPAVGYTFGVQLSF
jgi:hypothetical protein